MSPSFLLAGTYNVECVNSLSIALLKVDVENTFLFYTSSNIPRSELREVMNSVLFIRGSGLDAMFDTFGINCDPNTFRETLENWCTYYKRKWL